MVTKLCICGGKGGVGKTTCACAIAIHLVEEGNKTLLISTDPAHSTSDSLGIQLADKPAPIPEIPGLYGQEINPRAYLGGIDEANDGTMTKVTGIRINAEMYEFPGMDEFFAFFDMEDLLKKGDFDYVVLDTPPSGHALRFLSLPTLLDDWISNMERFMRRIDLIKSITTLKSSDMTKDIREMRREVIRLQAILEDSNRTSFFMVTIPELMAIEETSRTRDTLAEFQIPVGGIIINNITPDNSECGQCNSRHGLEKKYIRLIRAEFEGMQCARLRRYKHEIRGVRSLRKLGNTLAQQLDFSLSKRFRPSSADLFELAGIR